MNVRKNIPFARLFLIALIVIGSWLAATCQANAYSSTRTLWLHNEHTHENLRITFKRNGHYSTSALRKLNRFLRDWRRNSARRMDPKLFDLLWEVYQDAGARNAIHVLSGFRSKRTNNMLRRRSRAVAKVSQHIQGKAIDFFIPGVSVAKLRAIAMVKQRGGVGYYPRSGSPFVHLDTGKVRHWPRMTRYQLARLFPNGVTTHISSDGKPLRGYQQAKLKRNRQIAAASRIKRKKQPSKSKNGGFFGALFNLNKKPTTTAKIKKPPRKPTKKAINRTIPQVDAPRVITPRGSNVQLANALRLKEQKTAELKDKQAASKVIASMPKLVLRGREDRMAYGLPLKKPPRLPLDKDRPLDKDSGNARVLLTDNTLPLTRPNFRKPPSRLAEILAKPLNRQDAKQSGVTRRSSGVLAYGVPNRRPGDNRSTPSPMLRPKFVWDGQAIAKAVKNGLADERQHGKTSNFSITPKKLAFQFLLAEYVRNDSGGRFDKNSLTAKINESFEYSNAAIAAGVLKVTSLEKLRRSNREYTNNLKIVTLFAETKRIRANGQMFDITH